MRKASLWSLNALWSTDWKPWQEDKRPSRRHAVLLDHSPSCCEADNLLLWHVGSMRLLFVTLNTAENGYQETNILIPFYTKPVVLFHKGVKLETCQSAAVWSDLRCRSADDEPEERCWSLGDLSVLCWSIMRRHSHSSPTRHSQLWTGRWHFITRCNYGKLSQAHAHFVDYFMRQPGEDSEWVAKVGDDVCDLRSHVRGETRLHGHGFHPLRVVVCQRQNVFVSIRCLRQRSSDIQTEPLPRLCHLASKHHAEIQRKRIKYHRNICLHVLQECCN